MSVVLRVGVNGGWLLALACLVGDRGAELVVCAVDGDGAAAGVPPRGVAARAGEDPAGPAVAGDALAFAASTAAGRGNQYDDDRDSQGGEDEQDGGQHGRSPAPGG
jgi:hypothetical protein